jgi:hypothetical protein
VNYGTFVSSAAMRSSTGVDVAIMFPNTMRIPPTTIESLNLTFRRFDGTIFTMSSLSVDTATSTTYGVLISATISGGTAGHFGTVIANNNSSAYLGFSAEL